MNNIPESEYTVIVPCSSLSDDGNINLAMHGTENAQLYSILCRLLL